MASTREHIRRAKQLNQQERRRYLDDMEMRNRLVKSKIEAKRLQIEAEELGIEWPEVKPPKLDHRPKIIYTKK